MRRSGLLVTALLLGACAGPTQFLKKSYQPKDLEGKSVLIYPVYPHQVRIDNGEDFADDFEQVTGDPEPFMAGEINDRSGKYFGSAFKQVRIENADDSLLKKLTPANSDQIDEKIGEEPFEIRVPKKSYLESLNLKPAFVIVMDQVIFSRNLKTYQQTMPGAGAPNPGGVPAAGAPMMVTSSKKSISAGINYVIYDYGSSAVVGYGSAMGEKTFSFAMTRPDWYKAMENAFGNIKKFSPF